MSDNFYWLSTENDFTKLNELAGSVEVFDHDFARAFEVKLSNDTDKLAFFIRLNHKDKVSGVELTGCWRANYISSLPGENTEVIAMIDKSEMCGQAVV